MPDKVLESVAFIGLVFTVLAAFFFGYEAGESYIADKVYRECQDTGRFYSGYRVYSCEDLGSLLESVND